MSAKPLSALIEKVDISTFVSGQPDAAACDAVARSLRDFGAVLIRDTRVDASHSDTFLDMMERYFAQPRSHKMRDARPQLFYQVGVTPDGIERPRDNSALAATLAPSERPVSSPSARQKDPKWRFFWRVGPRPDSTDFPELNAPQVVPSAFGDTWARTMDAWGARLLQTVLDTAEMLALGLRLPRTAIRRLMSYGPHLLAPTGSDMSLYGHRIGTVLAGYHYDLSLLTIHGRSRYPGLFVWTRSGLRVPVVVPEGYLLVQSGLQLEYLTAGEIRRGMHEVVVSEETAAAARAARASGASMWRVSSTLFAHVASDASLAPLGNFANAENAGSYGDLKAGEQTAEELKALELAS